MEQVGNSSSSRLDLRVQLVVFSNGERCPMLIDGATGIPLFDPTVWTLTTYRRRSASTMEQALRGAMLIHLFCARRGIDLAERVQTGTFFDSCELDDLEREAARPVRVLAESSALMMTADGDKASQTRATSPLKRNHTGFLRRLPSVAQLTSVDRRTTGVRLYYLREYIKWLGDRQSFMIGRDAEGNIEVDRCRKSYSAALEKICVALTTRSGGVSGKSKRLALSPQQRKELLRVTDPDFTDNPWRDPFVRLRNHLIILTFLCTGMRRGELLSLKVRQIEMPLKRVSIVRNQDDKADPRRRQPAVKTYGRMVPLGHDLIALTHCYIRERARIGSARKHGFLMVSETGRPLSLSALTLIFDDLRRAFPTLGPVTAHVLRHTWNEQFSDDADEIGMDPDEERRVRIELMGWSPTSAMPDYYLRRKTIAKAAETSEAMQRRVMRDSEAALQRMPDDG